MLQVPRSDHKIKTKNLHETHNGLRQCKFITGNLNNPAQVPADNEIKDYGEADPTNRGLRGQL